MSERGSFVTEYIGCPECYKVMKVALVDGSEWKWLEALEIPGQPIIAGKVGETRQLMEPYTLPEKLDPVCALLCHHVQSVVICDGGELVTITVGPEGCEVDFTP